MFGKFFLNFFLLFISLTSFAGEIDTAITGIKSPIKLLIPEGAVKINLTALMDISRNSIFISYEKPFAKRGTYEVGAGWFFRSLIDANYKKESLNGLRLRAGIKYHFSIWEKGSMFIGGEAKYNFLSYNVHRRLCRYGCQYHEIKIINVHLHNAGIAFKGGFHSFIGNKNRFFYEMYAGLGYRFNRLKDIIPYDDAIRQSQGSGTGNVGVSRDVGNYHLPDLIMGINLGYSFGKNR